MPFTHSLTRRESAPVSPCYSPDSPRFPLRHSYSPATDSLDGYPWYAGMLSRDIAIQKLSPLPNGSYLIRISERAGNRGYAISIKFENEVMHMKVSRDDDGRFFLGASTKFPSLQKLVEHYQQVSLERIYPELKSVLAIPFKNARRPGRRVVGYCSALYDYSATEPSQLSLRKDEMITILSKADESKGWWRGESRGGKVGIFPVTYVQEVNGP